MEERFIIKRKDFKKLEKYAENIYNIAVVVDYFCVTQQEIEELYNLTPIVKNLRAEADFFCMHFLITQERKILKLPKIFKSCSKSVQPVD